MNRLTEYTQPFIKELKREWRDHYKQEMYTEAYETLRKSFEAREKIFKDIIAKRELEIKELKDELSYFKHYEGEDLYPQIGSGVIKQHIKDELKFLIDQNGFGWYQDPLATFYSLLDLYLPDGLWGVENGES